MQDLSELERKYRGYRLTTAEIYYGMPDHPVILQTYIWQEFDLAPRFPILNRFLEFWRNNLDGPIREVRVASRGLIAPSELRLCGGEFRLH